MRRPRLIAVLVVCALAFLLPLESAGTALAKAKSPYTTLKLRNGWQNAPFATSKAQVRNVSGIVYFKGAIRTSGNNSEPFVLPRAFRPHTWVYVPVDMCNATNGRLVIAPGGAVSVEAESDFSNAQCFTSLDGASFALSGKSFTTLSPRNGWTNAPFSTSDVKARDIGGIVHFKGAMSTTGVNTKAFVLPRSLRPRTTVYVQVDMCDATNGRLIISPNGAVNVEAELSFSDAQCFTSLDGASFAVSGKSFTSLRLRNGWKNAPFSTSKAQVRDIGGIVHFKGAIRTSGSSAVTFVLPRSFRPRTSVYAPVDMCGATNGRLIIQPSGKVSVEAQSNFANAQCFTSLDGAWFAQK